MAGLRRLEHLLCIYGGAAFSDPADLAFSALLVNA